MAISMAIPMVLGPQFVDRCAAESQGLTPDEHIPIAHQSPSSPAVAAPPGSSRALTLPMHGLGLARLYPGATCHI